MSEIPDEGDRMKYLKDAEDLQDMVGVLIAEALTEHWQKLQKEPR